MKTVNKEFREKIRERIGYDDTKRVSKPMVNLIDVL